jgi:type III restriction enzyme
MKVELFPFQKKALTDLRMKVGEAIGGYQRTHSNQVVSFTAPTGSGKTIIMASLIESIFFGDVEHPEQPEAIIIWLSDSPQLNEQSKLKIDLKADRIRLGQCITVSDDSFDQEEFDDGHIYFLNTQKLGKSSNLTKRGDLRTYTIWETLENTARNKSDRLYIIIDEAHRGMQGREAGRATTIMQKFLKGSPEDGLEAMPVVIGMSATSARFNALVQGTTSTTQYVVVTTDEVRASGLLKDRIVISYPEENTGNKDMAVLQAAADEWREKWNHWYQYCYEQHYAYVNPILVIQVQNRTGAAISATNLDDCVAKVEERCGIKFVEGEVVHTFGDTASTMQINGLNVPYVEPSAIAEDKRIRLVFFKESLSTGWDCPRAETMMSFRHASDATYIAQLLGRMIRTPMQMHIQVDETLNDVHLYLPYFDADTVNDVVKELQNSEGGELPADVFGESLESRVIETLSVRPRVTTVSASRHEVSNTPGQMSLFDIPASPEPMLREDLHFNDGYAGGTQQSMTATIMPEISHTSLMQERRETQQPVQAISAQQEVQTVADAEFQNEQEPIPEDAFDREAVMKAINDSGLLSYDVRTVRINNYLNSLYSLARLLTQSGKYEGATDDVLEEIVKMIREYVVGLKRDGKYDEMAHHVMEFEMKSQVFDVFGETMQDDNIAYRFMSTTDTDIDRQFRRAENRLGNEGAGGKS